jgi:hypothetical protein
MILMSHWSTEQSHNPVTRKLIDRPLVSVNLVHQDLEDPVHDLVDFLRIELLGDGGVVGNIGKEDGYQLSFPFNGATCRENLISEELRCVGLGLVLVDLGDFFPFSQIMSTFVAELSSRRKRSSTLRAGNLQFLPAFHAEARVWFVVRLTLRTFHLETFNLPQTSLTK